MQTSKEILENGYWSSSSSSSVRSEFDDEYYRMRPPVPKLEDYRGKIVVIKAGQFSHLEAQLPNVNLSNESKFQSNVQQKPDCKNLAVSSSKSETNVNVRKAPDWQRFERGAANINIRNDVRHEVNHGTSKKEFKISTTERNQSLTTNENFRRGPNYAGPFTNGNANGNNTNPHQYSIPQSNGVEDISSKRISQNPTPLYSINSQNTAEDPRREKIKPLPSQSKTPRSVKIENKQLENVPLPHHSASTVTTSSIITGRCNVLSRKVDTASGKSKSHSSNRSKTYNTFSAVQPTASGNNAIPIHQPVISNPLAANEETTSESANEKCYGICCFWFNCCA